jgi:hypothetical protein
MAAVVSVSAESPGEVAEWSWRAKVCSEPVGAAPSTEAWPEVLGGPGRVRARVGEQIFVRVAAKVVAAG